MLDAAGVRLGVDYPKRIITDLPAARAKTVRALLDMRARALHRNDAGGYDLIELPLTGETTRVFTKQEFRLATDGTPKPPPSPAVGRSRAGRGSAPPPGGAPGAERGVAVGGARPGPPAGRRRRRAR